MKKDVKNSYSNSKLAQYLFENGNSIGKMNDIMEIMHFNKTIGHVDAIFKSTSVGK